MNKKILNSSKQNIIFILLFIVFGLVSLQIPLSSLVASKAKFTLFDILAPTVGAFLGVIPGVGSILIVQVINTLIHGGFNDIASFIRPFPTLFAVYYFARKGKLSLAIPIIAIILFIANPVGRSVWYYSLFWTVPVIMHFFRDRFLFARSLGATFTAHAVGGALWIWTFNLPASFWQGLIPVVIIERLIFAAGISIVYVVTTSILEFIQEKKWISIPVKLDKKYALLKSSK